MPQRHRFISGILFLSRSRVVYTPLERHEAGGGRILRAVFARSGLNQRID